MPVVKMPDGQLVDMPDNPTPEQLAKLQAVQQSGGFMHKAGLVGSALARGAAALPALAVDMFAPQGAAGAEMASAAAGRAPDPKMQEIIRGKLPMGATSAVTKAGAQPQGKGEEYANAILQGIGGLATPGMGLGSAAAAPIRSTIAAGAGGAGAKLGEDLFPGNPLASLAGGVAAGGLAAGAANWAGGVRPQVKRIAQEAGEGLTPGQLDQAKAMQGVAKGQGIDVDLVQALDMAGQPTGNLETVRNILAQHSAGNKVQKTLRDQPAQYGGSLLSLDLPGRVLPDTVAANRVQEAATSAVDMAKKSRSVQVRPFYEKAGELTDANKQDLLTILDLARSQHGMTDDVKAAVATLRGKLEGSSDSLTQSVRAAQEAIAGAKSASAKGEARQALANANRALENSKLKKLHALDVDTFISELVGPFRGTPLTPADPKAAGQIKRLGKDLNAYLQNASPEIKAGEALYSKLSKEVVDPLKQSAVGAMATKRGYMADTQASTAKIETFFSRGSNPEATGTSDILTLSRELNKVDKEAFPNAAKTFISDRLAKAFDPEIKGVSGTSSDAAKRVWDSLFSNKRQMQGMRDMAAGMADAHGLPRKDVVDGLETFALITKGLKNRPRQVGGLDPIEVKQLGGGNRVSNVARIWGFLPFERVARKIEDKQLASTFAKFDELLTTPDGAALLAKLGKRSVMDEEALVMLAGFRSGAVSAAGESAGINGQ